MSFISKLFHKNDAADPPPAADQATQPDDGAMPVPAPDQHADDAVGQASNQPADAARTAAGEDLAGAADEPTAATPLADNAWWEESVATAPATEAPAHPELGEPVAPRSSNGTQPLHAEPDPQPLIAEAAAPATSSAPDADTTFLAPSGALGDENSIDLEDAGTRPLNSGDAPMPATLRSPRGLAVAALRDLGRVRAVNQDSIYAMTTTLPRENGDVTIGLFVVADGMGGHHGGEIASRLAISTVAHYVLAELVVPALADGTTEALQPLIIAAVQEANRAIWEHAQTLGSDMGTTCTVALLLGRALYLGHVGDSRAYLATPTGMKQITNDHSTVGRLIQVGQLDPAEAREHPLRSQLYRTVGQQPDVLVDFSYQQIGDATHLLLASDGLWGMLDDEVMLEVIEHARWPHDACNELIARANLAGGDDNISAIVVSLPA